MACARAAGTGVLVFLITLASIIPLTVGYAQTEDDCARAEFFVGNFRDFSNRGFFSLTAFDHLGLG